MSCPTHDRREFHLKHSRSEEGLRRQQEPMLTYGVIQISATALSAVSLAAIALAYSAIKEASGAFNACAEEGIADGMTNAEAVRFCNSG